MVNKSCIDFVSILASKEPVPGGGGASAIAGAMGMALGSMVGNLTLGKKKYADVQDDIIIILGKATQLQNDLLELVNKDAEAFEPLSKAYGLPKETEEQKAYKDKIMEVALKDACGVPIAIMKKALECIILHEELCEKGTAIAISDVGVGVLFVKSALMGASLNVFINVELMKDKAYAEKINKETLNMLDDGCKRADVVYKKVLERIGVK